MIRRVLVTAAAVVVLGLFGLWLLSLRPAIPPVERASQSEEFLCCFRCPGRRACSGWTLRVMPHAYQWTIVRRRIRGKHAVWNHLREQYYSGP
jgi:hypothetical protein